MYETHYISRRPTVVEYLRSDKEKRKIYIHNEVPDTCNNTITIWYVRYLLIPFISQKYNTPIILLSKFRTVLFDNSRD